MTTPLPLKIQSGYKAWSEVLIRERSGEHDFGSHWARLSLGQHWPNWRISWIEDTGELYAVDLSSEDQFIVIKTITAEAEVEKALAGWAYCIPDLDAIINQVVNGVKAPQPEPEPQEIVRPAFPDLADINLA